MKFIHTSDLQIGKAFGEFAPETAVLLQDARQAAIRALGEAAMASNASAVVIAGDIFERQQMSQASLMRAIETMRAFEKIKWHLLPGNHDHYREDGLWDRISRSQLPQNIVLHITAGAVQIADDDGVPVVLLPAPLMHRSSATDLTAYMDTEATADGAIRIGVAHGSIQGFGSEGDASNFVAPDRSARAGLAYLAMGDWHRQLRVNERCWYSGTPEPDRFKLPPAAVTTLCNGGAALLVELTTARAEPTVQSIVTGQYRWNMLQKTITDDTQVEILEYELRALDRDLGKVVLDLRVEGSLTLAGRKLFEETILQGACAGMRALRFDEAKLTLHPTDQDLDEIDRSGFVRVAADRLKLVADDTSDPQRARLASLALRRLYVEHLRQDGRS